MEARKANLTARQEAITFLGTGPTDDEIVDAVIGPHAHLWDALTTSQLAIVYRGKSNRSRAMRIRLFLAPETI